MFYGKGHYLETALYKIKQIPIPRRVCRADSFLYKYNDQIYVFFEKYSYKTKKGSIVCGKIASDNKNEYKITEIKDILDLEYHLSYPQIIKEKGEIFLIPETHKKKRLEVYKCVGFPDKWEFYATAFDGEEIVDTTYFCDDSGDEWLFMNKSLENHEELHIYKISSLKLENITPHKENPVLLDCRKTRNGRRSL